MFLLPTFYRLYTQKNDLNHYYTNQAKIPSNWHIKVSPHSNLSFSYFSFFSSSLQKCVLQHNIVKLIVIFAVFGYFGVFLNFTDLIQKTPEKFLILQTRNVNFTKKAVFYKKNSPFYKLLASFYFMPYLCSVKKNDTQP